MTSFKLLALKTVSEFLQGMLALNPYGEWCHRGPTDLKRAKANQNSCAGNGVKAKTTTIQYPIFLFLRIEKSSFQHPKKLAVFQQTAVAYLNHPLYSVDMLKWFAGGLSS